MKKDKVFEDLPGTRPSHCPHTNQLYLHVELASSLERGRGKGIKARREKANYVLLKALRQKANLQLQADGGI